MLFPKINGYGADYWDLVSLEAIKLDQKRIISKKM